MFSNLYFNMNSYIPARSGRIQIEGTIIERIPPSFKRETAWRTNFGHMVSPSFFFLSALFVGTFFKPPELNGGFPTMVSNFCWRERKSPRRTLSEPKMDRSVFICSLFISPAKHCSPSWKQHCQTQAHIHLASIEPLLLLEILYYIFHFTDQRGSFSFATVVESIHQAGRS